MTARRVIPSPQLPELKCDDPAVERFINQILHRFIAQNYQQHTRTALLDISNTFTASSRAAADGFTLNLSSAVVGALITETDAAADNGLWTWPLVNGEQLSAGVYNDIFSIYTPWLTVDRTGTTIDAVAIAATAITLTGVTVFAGRARLRGYTVATLPAGTIGDTAYVTDALAPVFGAAVAGGGAVMVPVYYTGAAWFVG